MGHCKPLCMPTHLTSLHQDAWETGQCDRDWMQCFNILVCGVKYAQPKETGAPCSRGMAAAPGTGRSRPARCQSRWPTGRGSMSRSHGRRMPPASAAPAPRMLPPPPGDCRVWSVGPFCMVLLCWMHALCRHAHLLSFSETGQPALRAPMFPPGCAASPMQAALLCLLDRSVSK